MPRYTVAKLQPFCILSHWRRHCRLNPACYCVKRSRCLLPPNPRLHIPSVSCGRALLGSGRSGCRRGTYRDSAAGTLRLYAAPAASQMSRRINDKTLSPTQQLLPRQPRRGALSRVGPSGKLGAACVRLISVAYAVSDMARTSEGNSDGLRSERGHQRCSVA